MLAELTPQQFAEWLEAERIGVFDGASWYQAGTIACAIHDELEIITTKFAKHSTPQFRKPSDYIPKDMRPDDNVDDTAEDASVQRFANNMEQQADQWQ